MNTAALRWPLAALWLAIAANASAHSFGEPYQLPMPYWMYIYGAMAALVLSFIVLAYFLRGDSAHKPVGQKCFHVDRLLPSVWQTRLRTVLQALISGAFLLSIISGLIGSQDAYRNFNMTFFWIVFALGGVYLSALIGNWYHYLNPWQNLSRLLPARGRFAYPERLGYWPAVVLYMGFIALELFASIKPFSLSVSLLVYTLINLAGSWLFGRASWFHFGEFFAVMFRLTAMMSPLRYGHSDGRFTIQLRLPFAGLIGERAERPGLIVFVLFMLSSTAFDGLRETTLWFNLFWKDPLNLLTPLLGQAPIFAYVQLRPWYIALENLTLVLSPFLYLALFWVFLWLGKILTRATDSMAELTRCFTFSLLPIALVYHVTHYYSLLLSQGVKLRALISDPFGWGWNLFGTAITGRVPIIPDMGFIWDSQVWLILIGHVASVVLAHAEALRLFPRQSQASLSQLPMLGLMVIFTGAGLWILAQPLQG